MNTLAEKTGLVTDDLKLVFCILIQLPISFLFRKLPTKTAQNLLIRKLVAAAVGLWANFYCFDFYGNMIFVFAVICSYFMSLKCTTRKNTLFISFLTFSALCAANIIRLFVDYEGNSNNVSLLFMMITPRMIYFNWTVNRHHESKTTEIPSISDYLFFIFNFLGGLCGPVFNYEEHDAFIRQTYPRTAVDWRLISRTAGEVLLYSSIYVVSLKFYDYHLIEKPEFRQLNMLLQVGVVVMESFFIRTRYMFIWRLEYIQMIAANVRCSDCEYKNYIQTVNFGSIELENSMKVRVDNWNMSIQKWLKNCFYLPGREVLKLSAPNSSLLTFVVSAFWHGFYPTYYASFIAWNFVSESEKLVYKCPPLYYFFPTFYFRFQQDLNGLLFKRYLGREWWPAFHNLKFFFFLNFATYAFFKVACPLINTKFGQKKEKSKIVEVEKETQKVNAKKRD